MYKVPRARPEKKHSKYEITIPFVNKTLDFHVLPGNLKIVKKMLNLGNFYQKDLNSGRKQKSTGRKLKLLFLLVLTTMLKWFKVKGVSKVYFDDWRNTILSQIYEKINTNKQRFKAVDRKSVFEDPDAKQELDSLQSDFISPVTLLLSVDIIIQK